MSRGKFSTFLMSTDSSIVLYSDFDILTGKPRSGSRRHMGGNQSGRTPRHMHSSRVEELNCSRTHCEDRSRGTEERKCATTSSLLLGDRNHQEKEDRRNSHGKDLLIFLVHYHYERKLAFLPSLHHHDPSQHVFPFVVPCPPLTLNSKSFSPLYGLSQRRNLHPHAHEIICPWSILIS